MKKKKFSRVVTAMLAVVLTISGMGVTTFASGIEEAGSISEAQMSSDPEMVYVNSYSNPEVRTQNFDSNWKFNLGDVLGAEEVGFNDSEWENISIPHDYSITQDYSKSGEAESGYLPGGIGWYRKRFHIPENMEGKEIRLDFDGVYMNATVYINGEKLGTHPFGYTPFSFDITKYINVGGENIIAVKVDHKTPSSRWYSGSGIYRSVNLTVMDKVHVDLNGIKVETPNLKTEKNGTVNTKVKTTISNKGDEAAEVVLVHTIFPKGGNVNDNIGVITTDTKSVAAGSKENIEAIVSVENPTLWSIENPKLYTIRTEVKVRNIVVDTYDTEYGFRYFEMDKDTGASLNGENIKLKGVCMHHDQGALGAAAYRRAIERQIDILKAMGCNSIRVTHNPAASVLIEICNDKGMLVIDEIFDGWMYEKNENTYDYSHWFNKTIEESNTIIGKEDGMTWAKFNLQATIARGQNDPSVIMWSLGNEIQEGTSVVNGGGYANKAKELIQWAKEIDDTRLLTIGSNAVKNGNTEQIKVANEITNSGGASGTNYSDGNSYDMLHKQYKDWILYGSETASSINSRGVYTFTSGNQNNQCTSYDNSKVNWGAFASSAWFDVITRDFVAGEYVWTGFDYIGEPTPWNGTRAGAIGTWPSPKSSYFGIVDTAGFPKDSYYFYQSQWNDNVKTLHVLPTWNEDSLKKNSNNEVDVVVYSDAAKVELYLNDRKVGTQEFEKKQTDVGYTYQTVKGKTGHTSMYMTFKVPYEAGTLKAVAYDENGQVIKNTEGRSTVKTTGNKSKLLAVADRTEIVADGKDLTYVSVDVTDEEGNIIPNAADRVKFDVKGDGVLVGVDNGNSPDHDSYKSDNRKAFNGKVLAIVQSTTQSGSFTVTASAEGLKESTVKVITNPVSLDDTNVGKQIDSFKMIKNYYVKVGNKPILPCMI